MHKQNGFTLIELVIVIVILGILAVTAAPRFLNLQSDARLSALEGMKGAMASASNIVYSKAVIAELETVSAGASISDGINTIAIVHGYPKASPDGIGNAVQGLNDNKEWTIDANDVPISSNPYLRAGKDINAIDAGKCYVQYTQSANNGDEPEITIESSGC
ncbi:type II secretion system protein [Vibrio rarus]|uniref:type II secretion system protein n=1 Tax=Vibrio rarus TaxID=413403 RepID=UPI0021C31C37|nr:type II secretion system protein [Vibrio rarus]